MPRRHLLQLVACSRSTPQQAATFTLESGINVTEQTECSPPAQIQKEATRVYKVKLNDVFGCDARIQPYLTEPVDNKATLVLTLGELQYLAIAGRRIGAIGE